jgi:hypothetical protein
MEDYWFLSFAASASASAHSVVDVDFVIVIIAAFLVPKITRMDIEIEEIEEMDFLLSIQNKTIVVKNMNIFLTKMK